MLFLNLICKAWYLHALVSLLHIAKMQLYARALIKFSQARSVEWIICSCFFILILFVAQLREIETVVYDMHFLLYRLTF